MSLFCYFLLSVLKNFLTTTTTPPPPLSCIMWQSDLAACGHVGVATRAGGVLFVTRRAARACEHVAAVVSWVLSIDSGGRVWTCSYKHVFFLIDSLMVTHVEFPTFLSFESETCRASVFWETRGWHDWRILLRQRENYWGSRTVGASCGVTVCDSPW